MIQNYTIDDKEKIIYICYEGKMTVDDLNNNYLKLMEDSRFNPNYNILTDGRKCEALIQVEPTEIAKHVQLIKENFGSCRIKNAILVDSPIETAIAVLFQDMAIEVREVEVFCTEEGALNWLKSPPLYQEISPDTGYGS